MTPTPKAAPETAPVRADEQMDWPRLTDYLRQHPSLAELDLSGEMSVLQFPGGHANLTYLLRFGETELVLRRPPLGPIAVGAPDMGREFKVLSKLHKVFDQAPRIYLFCDNEAVIGAPFVATERRVGFVLRAAMPEEMIAIPDVNRRVSHAVIDAMAGLHQVDADAAGLSDLGRPEGFAARQVAGWHKRWQAAEEDETPAMDEVFARLQADIPATCRISIVHNDLKMDNCQFRAAAPDKVATIFDWDMATLGDPLMDLGMFLAYWHEEGDTVPRAPQPLGAPGPFPTRAEMTQRYGARTGFDISRIAWYETFALWKAAVIAQQLYIRYRRGQTKDIRFADNNKRAEKLANLAAERLRG